MSKEIKTAELLKEIIKLQKKVIELQEKLIKGGSNDMTFYMRRDNQEPPRYPDIIEPQYSKYTITC